MVNTKVLMIFTLLASFICQPGSLYALEAAKKQQAVLLTEKAINTMMMKTHMLDGSGKTGPYHNVCDASEAAYNLFKLAVDADPGNVEAWYGWGQSIVNMELCFNQYPFSWNQMNNFEYYDSLRSSFLGTLRGSLEAKDKFQKAIEIEPGNGNYWQALGSSLFACASAEINDEKRRALARQGSEKYAQALSIEKNDAELQRRWALDLLAMLPSESDPLFWNNYIKEALEHLDAYGAQKSKDERINKVDLQLMLINDVLSFCFFNGMTDEKNMALLQAAQQKLANVNKNISDAEREMRLAVDILAIFLEEDQKKWSDSLSNAFKLFEQHNLKKMKDSKNPEYFSLQHILFMCQIFDSQEKKQAVAKAALPIFKKIDALDKNEVAAKEMLIANKLKTDILALIASFLPKGRERSEVINTIRLKYKHIEAKMDQKEKNRAQMLFAQQLLNLASSEKDEENYKKIINEAYAILEGSLGQDYNEGYIKKLFFIDHAIEMEKRPEHRRALLHKELEVIDKIDVNAAQSEMLISKGSIYYRLALLEQEDLLKRRGLLDRAIRAYAKQIEETGDSDGSLKPYSRTGRLFFGILLCNIAFSEDGNRNDLLHSMNELRQHFYNLPANKEKADRRQRLKHMNGKYDEQALGFQEALSAIIADSLLNLYAAYDIKHADAWQLTQLAGLHRYLAFSGMLTPNYQDLYLQRAEKYLRRAISDRKQTGGEQKMEPISREHEKPQAEANKILSSGGKNKLSEAQVNSDIALAMSELALLLAERAQLESAIVDADKLREVENLWSESEKICPGASRYAKARWYARTGKKEKMKEYLQHSYSDLLGMRFPSLEEAQYDPALSDYVNEPWFNKLWYGFKN